MIKKMEKEGYTGQEGKRHTSDGTYIFGLDAVGSDH